MPLQKYSKILALNKDEANKKRLIPRLNQKYDKNHVPTAYERFLWLINFLFPYFKTIKIVMTIFTPSKSPHIIKRNTSLILNFNNYSLDYLVVCEESESSKEQQGKRNNVDEKLVKR